MNNFIFENSTKVYFGQGCVKEYLACKVRPYETILLGYGGGSIKKNGIYREVQDILQNAGKTVVEFHDILPNPTYQKVQEGTRLARKHNVDMILAVGGGSVIDCCKAVSLAARYEGDIWEDYWEHPGVIHTEPLPLGTIVTTAGTGSECNGGAVITHEEKKIKTGRDYPQLNPRFALMDPTYTYSVPVKQMVSGGFDILSHIMETYRQMEKAYKEGKVKAIGLSNFNQERIQEILSLCEVKPAVLQTEVHPYYQEQELKKFLAKEGMVIQAWYPLGHGDKSLLEEPLFTELGKKYGKTNAQIILRWHIQDGNIVIPGSKNPAHIKDNFDLFDFSLTEEEMGEIAALDKNARYYHSTPEMLKKYAEIVPDVDGQK